MSELVLVTGSSGFLGHALCQALNEKFLVLGFDREGDPYPPPNVEWIFADVTSDESLQTSMHMVENRYGRRIASVCHLAAYYDFSGRESNLYKKITVGGTERLLRELERFEVEQLIFSSSMLVHKPTHPGSTINEESPRSATWAYPQSKIETEDLIQNRAGKFNTVFLRIAGVYDTLCHSIPIAHQIQRTYENTLISHFFPGDTSAGQSFVHLKDAIDSFIRTIERRHELPKHLALLIGEPETLSYAEVQGLIEQTLFGKQSNIWHVSKPAAKIGAWLQNSLASDDTFIKPWMIDRADDHYALNVEKAYKYLNWRPTESLRETLPLMVEALKADPIAWYEANGLTLPSWLSQRIA